MENPWQFSSSDMYWDQFIRLFGSTILQAYQYFLQYYEKDSRLCKTEVAVVCILDLLHLVFATDIMYMFLVTSSGAVDPAGRVPWSIKALGVTQAALIVSVQLLYLKRIYSLARKPTFNSEGVTKLVVVLVLLIGTCAIGTGIVFCYELEHFESIQSFGRGISDWVIYLGFGATSLIDIAIAALMCFLVHKNKFEFLSSQLNRILSSLALYALSTGLITAFMAIVVIVLYVARPNTFVYIAITFFTTRLYTNSLLAMFHSRKKYNAISQETRSLELVSNIKFSPNVIHTGTYDIKRSVLPLTTADPFHLSESSRGAKADKYAATHSVGAGRKVREEMAGDVGR
ncbi:hypothetical protein D9756_009914 [Leucocoprinus leucothites]|uniref:DUF6534 domain-containing protein n=1 Tax=Leucocoprinus leucothites TaxID=201217 RepID=A0A8H5CUJ2_9AGAR|nr:hypothetical protein D9756_009914 [Leucoagaricus leucothites]